MQFGQIYLEIWTYLANLWPAAVADLINRLVALPHRLVESLLGEGDGALLVKVLLAHLLGRWIEGGDVGVVTCLNVPVMCLSIATDIIQIKFSQISRCLVSKPGWIVYDLMDVGGICSRLRMVGLCCRLQRSWTKYGSAAISIRGIPYQETVWILFLI